MSDQERKAAARSGTVIQLWADRQPDAPAVITPTGTRTFGQLSERADRIVAMLHGEGLGPGDGVAAMLTNRVEFVDLWAAVYRSGLRLTPINWHLTADEAAYIVEDCEAKAFVTDVPAGAEAARSTGVRAWSVGPDHLALDPFEVAVSASTPEPGAEPVAGGHMFYTSGTTGRPKGVFRPGVEPPGVTNAQFVTPEDIHLCTGPLYHLAPYNMGLTGTLPHGGSVVLMERWDAADFLRLVEAHSVTQTHLVPTMFHRLLALPEQVRTAHDPSSLELILHGAAPCPVHVKRAIIEWFGPIVVEYYAATEGAATLVDSETWLAHPGTVGRPANEQAYVGDDTGEAVPAGDVGLVWMKADDAGAGRFSYFKADGKTTSTYRADGAYFTLGDMGYLDEDGYLFLTDRSADLIISGGVNIYPAEVDAVLLQHPAVADGAAYGEPDDEWGESVVAALEVAEGYEAGEALADELRAFCRERLAHFKCPRRIRFVDEIPRSDAGKVRRRMLDT